MSPAVLPRDGKPLPTETPSKTNLGTGILNMKAQKASAHKTNDDDATNARRELLFRSVILSSRG
eukprot:5201840-Amphidinium_carterae.1